ncbi:MAG TPA: UDP-N-acetylglucosamine 2-epimerase (non-hydrolyzing), partial [Allosphingosinicella sp.]|nr:UDP-N-acetylglucosamine 2-epimerase (non-hydrolyzing) [Allosphingosinicella sp.]
AFFGDLGLPEPDFHLGVGSGGHGAQTGRVMIEYEAVATAHRPDWLVVVGDVNSTVAAAMVGVKLGIPTVHLEAGLRSRDRRMPEEINRLATDAIADVLWTPSADADRNLIAEGIPAERITLVGNIMLDSFEACRPAIAAAGAPAALGLAGAAYGVVTLHRPSNVDDPEQLRRLAHCLISVQQRLPIVFPVHPRTAARLAEAGLEGKLRASGVRLIEPLPYASFMSLVVGAAAVVTDSGGLQEETTYLGIPCFTLRDNTERPITVDEGTNRLVTAAGLPDQIEAALEAGRARPRRPLHWDGKTAPRCLADLRRRSKRRIRAAA